MSDSLKLVAFCGSLRKASLNRQALHAFVERLPAGASAQTIEIGDWPLYDADIQANGFPDKVQAAQKAMLIDELTDRAALTPAQLGRLLGIPSAQVRALLQELENDGIVVASGKVYRLKA